MKDYLDWSHAWPQAVALTHAPSSGISSPDVALQNAHIKRLTKELPELPFLSLPFAEDLKKELGALEPYFRKFKHLLLLGIGGSALGPRALQKAFFPEQDRPCHQGPWIWIADNVDPSGFSAYLQQLPADQTLVMVISKSGGTIETVAQYFLALEWLKKSLPQGWQDHLLYVTDVAKGFLRDEANKYQARSLTVPDNLGGRYSVLSAVGLAPAAFLGMDWKGLLDGATSLGRPLAQNPALLPAHPAWKLALWAKSLADKGLSQLIFFCYAPEWATFGPWFAQLWAESLGKEGKGTMPLPAVGVTDQHSLLQMFLDGPKDKGCLFLTAPGENPSSMHLPANLPEPWGWLAGSSLGQILEAETLATKMSLAKQGLPLVHLNMADSSEASAGKMMMLLEAATVFTGWLLEINPIDQPAVEQGKRLAYARLGAPGRQAEADSLAAFVDASAQKEVF